MTTIHPCGSWPSKISAEQVAGKSLRLAEPQLHDGNVYWLETRPQEQGRTVLVKWSNGATVDLTPPPFSVQSKVHGYGGGAYRVTTEGIFFVNRSDQSIWHIAFDLSPPRKLFAAEQMAVADFELDAARQRLIVIAEQHRETETRNFLAAISLQTGQLSVLAEGADFCSSPALSPDGRQLAFLEWHHPDMPWDNTTLKIMSLTESGDIAGSRIVADRFSNLQPGWLSNDELLYVSDRSNWWNLVRHSSSGDAALLARDAEFALPQWVFGRRTWATINATRIVAASTRDGRWFLDTIDTNNGQAQTIESDLDCIEQLAADAESMVVLGGNATSSLGVWRYHDSGWTCLRSSGIEDLPVEYFSRPQSVSFATTDGMAHGFYYPPCNPACTMPENEKPPLLIKCHGGPTAATSPLLDMKIQFWTSRGFAVLDINYRGSTGYGRDYRESLYGQWGVADVEDIIAAADFAAREGLADEQRMVLSGSSAGAFTLLNALVASRRFAAAASYYGIGEPVSAMRDTEKFESRYGDKLIGPLPETIERWQARSPLRHADRITTPVIFLQGLDDTIVPPAQSRDMANALRRNGIPVALIEFPEEGHGFRRADTITRALQSEYAFYCRILGIVPASGLPELQIDNLSAIPG